MTTADPSIGEHGGSLARMRTVICDDDAFVRLVGNGELYDYELGERYIVAPAARGNHGKLQARLIGALAGTAGMSDVSGPVNLGVLGEPGRRWYVVPDVVVLPAGAAGDAGAYLRALLALEIRSPGESVTSKLAAYREVAERTGLVVDEVWYVDGAAVTVHPLAAEEPGTTRFVDALAAVQAAIDRFATEG